MTIDLSLSQAAGNARLALAIISGRNDVDMSYEELAKQMGCSKRTAQRAVKTLQELGEIEVETGTESHWSGNVYRPTDKLKKPRKGGVTKLCHPHDTSCHPSGDTALSPPPSNDQPVTEGYIYNSNIDLYSLPLCRDGGSGGKGKNASPDKPQLKSKKAVQLPDDWQPNDRAYQISIEEGYDDDDRQFIVDQFRNWAAANGTTKLNWHATFYNWIRSHRTKRDVELRRKQAQRSERSQIHVAVAAVLNHDGP